jgi:hypothetical protein
MLKDLSVKKIVSIALSIAWIDFIASQKCINYQCCPDNCKAFFAFGVAPVAAIWILYCAFYGFNKKKEKPEEAVEHIYIDSEGKGLK